jgi:hypothetical protein
MQLAHAPPARPYPTTLLSYLPMVRRHVTQCKHLIGGHTANGNGIRCCACTHKESWTSCAGGQPEMSPWDATQYLLVLTAPT